MAEKIAKNHFSDIWPWAVPRWRCGVRRWALRSQNPYLQVAKNQNAGSAGPRKLHAILWAHLRAYLKPPTIIIIIHTINMLFIILELKIQKYFKKKKNDIFASWKDNSTFFFLIWAYSSREIQWQSQITRKNTIFEKFLKLRIFFFFIIILFCPIYWRDLGSVLRTLKIKRCWEEGRRWGCQQKNRYILSDIEYL